MTYIQIPEKHNAIGFLALAKSGRVLCLPQRTYGVEEGHLQVLREKRIPFKRIPEEKVCLPWYLSHLNEKV